jgi:hypothetical protein
VRDLILDGEDVGEVAVVPVGPDVVASHSVNQLRGDSHPPAGLAHAAFDDVADVQLFGDLGDIHRLALEGEDGVSGDDRERGDLREVRDDILRDAIAEVLLFGIAAHVDERQDSNRKLQGLAGSALCALAVRTAGNHVYSDGFRHVLQAMLAEVLEADLDLAAHVTEHRLGHEDSARLGQALDPCGDVDPAVEIAAFDHDVA